MTNASSMTMRRTIGNCIFNFGQVMRYRSPRHHGQITVIKHHRWDSKKVTFIDCSLVYSVFLLPHLLHLRTNLPVCLTILTFQVNLFFERPSLNVISP